LFIVPTTLKTTNFKSSTYAHISATKGSHATVPQTTERSTLSNTESSRNSLKTATEMTISLIYSSELTTEQSATTRKSTKQSTSNIQHTTEYRETRSQTTSKFTSQTSTSQSYTMLTTNKKSSTSKQGMQLFHYVN